MSPQAESIFQIRCDAAMRKYFVAVDGDDDAEAFRSLSGAIGYVKLRIDRPTEVRVCTSRKAEIMRVTVLPKERPRFGSTVAS
jgi:hypothetical protein